MVKQAEIIKVKPIFVVLILCFQIGAMTFIIIMSNRQAAKLTEADFTTQIDTITITGKEPYFGGRGGECYAKDKYISTSAILIENSTNFDDWSSGAPIISFSSTPYQHTLGDLGLPYTIYKKANSDTVYIIKDGHLLKFLMQENR